MPNVLLVEDLDECQIVVKRALANSSIELTIAKTLKEAQTLIRSNSEIKYDLVILDISLPDGEGLSILEEIRTTTGDTVPVFLLTSDSDLDSKVTAFNLGADDYLTKPISGAELRARVEMRLKKTAGQRNQQTKIQKGNLALDVSLMRVSLIENNEQKILPLTSKEFKILALLTQHEGQVYSRHDLVKHVWGDSIHVQERTVDSHIFGLRKKLGSYADYIECIPHVGYRFIGQAGHRDSAKKDIA